MTRLIRMVAALTIAVNPRRKPATKEHQRDQARLDRKTCQPIHAICDPARACRQHQEVQHHHPSRCQGIEDAHRRGSNSDKPRKEAATKLTERIANASLKPPPETKEPCQKAAKVA